MQSAATRGPRIALVHDWLNQQGGAENVLAELVALFPGAPVYTSIYDRARMPPFYREWQIRTSFMQRLPGVFSHHQAYMPIYPLAFGRLQVGDHDLVVSNKSGFCHGVDTSRPAAGRQATHICYCLTPTRFLWRYAQYREREQIHPGLDWLLQFMLSRLRRWDWAAAQRVDHFVAISSAIRDRIRECYGRESVIIYPPVDTAAFTPSRTAGGGYYLIVSRLIPYKRIDLAVQAFARLPQETLLVVGEGRDRPALEAAAGPNVSFLGRQPPAQLVELVRGCKAFIFPGEEDFGIAPVEAMSAGRPVIAYGAGGALDTVVPGVTGLHFHEPSADALAALLVDFEPGAFDPAACRAQAERFDRESFQRRLLAYVGDVLGAR